MNASSIEIEAPRPQVAAGLARTQWHDALERELPPQGEVRHRNAAITATYARWYRDHPHLFKWAGMAAFASHHIGLALASYDTIALIDDIVTDLGDGHPKDLALYTDINLLRQTNNVIFADIGWAHAALIDPEGGIAAIESELRGQSRYDLMLEGFREIAAGRALLTDPNRRTAADQRIWRGNQLLLQHEQWITVQPQFEKLTPAFEHTLSAATSIDFGGRTLFIDWRSNSWFPLYMYTRGLATLLRTRSWPDIVNLDHRWHWVSRRVLPIWRRVATSDRRLPARIDRFVNHGTNEGEAYDARDALKRDP